MAERDAASFEAGVMWAAKIAERTAGELVGASPAVLTTLQKLSETLIEYRSSAATVYAEGEPLWLRDSSSHH